MAKKVKVFSAYVRKGHLYEVMGEDGMLTVYDLWIDVVDDDGAAWTHQHVFKGWIEEEAPEDCGGGVFVHADKLAEEKADRLCDRIKKAGYFDPDYWYYYGYEDEASEEMFKYGICHEAELDGA